MLKRIFTWRKEIPYDEREEMEAALEDVYQPIIPRPQFVNGLRRILKNHSMIDYTEDAKINQQGLIMMFAGFFSAALLLSIGIRALITLIGAIGVIHYHKRQLAQNQSAASIETTI